MWRSAGLTNCGGDGCGFKQAELGVATASDSGLGWQAIQDTLGTSIRHRPSAPRVAKRHTQA